MQRIVVCLSVLVVVGCSKSANVNLKLVEPCDQKNQALNGVSSFKVSSTGATDPTQNDVVAFALDQPAPLQVGLGNIVITVQAFTDPGGAAGNGVAPKSIGRTPPLPITPVTGDVTSMVLMGEVDSFGKTTAKDGSCTQMTGDGGGGRHGATATFVPIVNKVLIVGGARFDDQGKEVFLSDALLFDPADGSYTSFETGHTRAYHAASALPDGRVVITGGLGVTSGQVGTLQSGLIFDPITLGDTDPFSVFIMKQARAHHTSTLMPDSDLVVIAGGCTGNSEADGCTTTGATTGSSPSTALTPLIETFDAKQATNGATTVASTVAFTQRAFHQATLLENGADSRLVITGGANPDGPIAGQPAIEIYGVQGGLLTKFPSPPSGFPTGKTPLRHAAVAIDAHRLLVIGGQVDAPGGQTRLSTGEDPPGTADVWLWTDSEGIDTTALIQLFNGGGRVAPQALPLNDGSVVVIGGKTVADAPPAEILRAGLDGQAFKADVLKGNPLAEAREDAALAVLPTNAGVYCGGFNSASKDSSACETYFGP